MCFILFFDILLINSQGFEMNFLVDDSFECVFIIGVGVVGFVVVQVLQYYGCRVIVFEVCNRVGGWMSMVDVDGVFVDEGVVWIDGYKNNLLMVLFDCVGLKMMCVDYIELFCFEVYDVVW